MSLACPYRHVSYATWRLQIFRRLCKSIEPGFFRDTPALPTPFPFGVAKSKRNQSTFRAFDEDKNNVPETIRDGNEWVYDAPGKRSKLRPHNKSNPGSSRNPSFNPYSSDGRNSIRNLVSQLKPVIAKARRKDADTTTSDAVSIESTRLPRTPILKRTGPKHMEAKRMPTEAELDALKTNIWAQMLAAPLRACQGSFARLPSPFMMDLDFVEDPEKKAIHLAPAQLADLDALEARMARELSKENWLRTRKDNDNDKTRAQRQQQHHDDDEETSESSILPQPQQQQQPPPPPPPPTTTSTTTSAQKVKQRPKSRLLADINLVRFLTLKLMERSKRVKGKIVSKPNALARLVPAPLKEALEKAQHYSINKRKIDTATGVLASDETEPLQMEYLSRLQWQVDMYERIPRMMRKRILVALKALAEQATSEVADGTGNTPKAMALSVVAVDDDDAAVTTSLTTNHIDCPCPPPDSIILHIGEGDTRALSSSISISESEANENQPPLPSNWLVPPMINVVVDDGSTHRRRRRLPVFSLSTMFVGHAGAADHDISALSELTSQYKKVLLRHDRNTSTENDRSKDHFILVRPGVGPPKVLMEEVWQLWRYLGGSNMGLVHDEETERCFDQGILVK
ncbi:hypothetical protein LTS17_007863 [Exophiala oligosperma]